MPPNLCLFLVFFSTIVIPDYRVGAIGVNWGTAASHPLPPPKVVELLKSYNIAKVKLFDADPLVLQALSGSNIGVTVGIPNSMLKSFNSSRKAADTWVHDNVTRYFSSTARNGVRIEYIAVGDEPTLQRYSDQFYPFIVGAATNIQSAITRANLEDRVKVVVPCSFDSFQSDSTLPSKGHFRPDLNKTMIQLLTFLTKHHSPFFITLSPFTTLHQNKNISLGFTLFKETARPINDSHRIYKNTLELNYDTFITALSTAGFASMDVVVAQIGWPTDGAVNANSSIAESFMKGLMNHVLSKSGTPLRPRIPPLDSYIFSLLDEDQRNMTSEGFEKHWGVFTFDGQAKYRVNLASGSTNLANALNVDYLPSKWCVVNNNKDLSNANLSAAEACSSTDCAALSPGGSCSGVSWPVNISYAFNSYYQEHDQRADSCDFQGLGLITTVDPSINGCRFLVQIQTSRSMPIHGDNIFRLMTLPLAVILVVF